MQTVPMRPLDKFLMYAVRYGLFAVFALPFIVWLTSLYPWVTGKVIGFEVIVEALFPFYAFLALRRKEFRPSKNPYFYALLAYFAVATLAMIFGQNPERSMWSKPDRLTGMFFQYHLLAFFLMAGAMWRKIFEQPIVVAVVTAVILSLHALSQVLHPAAGSDGRGAASLGNPDYLGQYLVPHLFLCVWLLRRHWRTGWRWALVPASAVILAGIISAQSKGALVGVTLGAIVLSAFFALRSSGKTRQLGMIGLGIVALAIVSYLIGQKIRPVNRWLYDHRFSIQYLQETTGSRALLLKNATKGISQHPVLGWGPENFEDGFYFNYDPATLRFSEYESRQDRPHNLVLEILHNLGVLGFLAYAAVFYFAARLVLKKGGPDLTANAVLFAAAVSQLSTNLFIFETPMSYVALFVMFSLLAASAADGDLEEGGDESSAAAAPFFLLLLALTFWCLRYVIVGTVRSARITAQLIVSLQSKPSADDWNAQLAELRSLKTPYYERDIRALVSHLSRARGEYLEGDFKPILVSMAEEEYAHLQKNTTDYVEALVTGSSYLSFQPRSEEQQAALERVVEWAHEDAPNRQEVEVMLAQVAWEKGDLQTAETHMRRVVDLDPELLSSWGWWIRWQLEFGDPVEAAKTLSEHPGAKGDKDAWSQAEFGTLHLLNQKHWKDLDALQKASAQYGVRNVQWDLTGALALWALGDKQGSDALVADAKTLYPDQVQLIETISQSREQIVTNGG